MKQPDDSPPKTPDKSELITEQNHVKVILILLPRCNSIDDVDQIAVIKTGSRFIELSIRHLQNCPEAFPLSALKGIAVSIVSF
jgi:hypothetical protein